MTVQPQPFHVMLKPRGAVCDLDCAYCYYLDKQRLYPGSDFRMSEALLERVVRQIIDSRSGPVVTFAWQGGEPTLAGLDFFERATALQTRYCPAGVTIANTIQTNAASLDEAWCRFLKDHDFLVGVSLDGPQHLHDAYRVDKAGKPTFARVMAGLNRLAQHDVATNILTTLHAVNAPYPLEVYRFLRDDVGARYLQFIPIVEHEGATEISARSITAKQYGDFLIAVFDEWLRADVGRVFVQIFDVALAVWCGLPAGLCIFEETCGRALALEHTGDLYSCDHFVEPAYRLGRIDDAQALVTLAADPRQQAFGLAKRETLPAYCRACEVRFMCNGGCPKDRFATTPDGEPGLNALCAGYRAFFNHIDAPMRRMATQLRRQR